MAEIKKPIAPPAGAKPPVPRSGAALPFSVNDDEWESELAAWDAHLPLVLEAERAASAPAPLAPPDEENPFASAPTTAVSVVPSTPFIIEPATRSDFEAATAPGSGVYTSMVAFDDESDSLFQQEPPPEPEVSLVAEPLPEMAADIWRHDLRQLVNAPEPGVDGAEVPDEEARRGRSSSARPSASREVRNPSEGSEVDDYWKRWQQLLLDELNHAETAAQQVDLTLAAARVAELTGDAALALRLNDDVLTLQPRCAPALRARLRLFEQQGKWQAAMEALARLASVTTGEEHDHYRATLAEWRLARGSARPDDLGAFPAGVARALAAAELALRRGDHAGVASAFEESADVIGGSVGSAFLAAAARFSEAGGDAKSAAAERFVAWRLENSLPVALGRLRDAARRDAEGAAESVAAALQVLPSGAFKTSVARWGAALARRRGDRAFAGDLLLAADPAGSPSISPALTRDLLQLLSEDAGARETFAGAAAGLTDVDADAVAGLFARARALWPSPEAGAVLAMQRARWLMARGQDDEAQAVLQEALEQLPDAVPLALVAERLGRSAAKAPARAAALRLWGRFDPARRAAAALAVADVLDDPAAGSIEAAGDALRAAAAAAPGSATFWRLAAHAHAAGSLAAAADALAAGATAWTASALGPALTERAHEVRAATVAPPARRSAERSSDVRPHGDPVQALAVAPADPAALALLLADGSATPQTRAEALWRAGVALGAEAGGRACQLQAISWWDSAGEPLRALALAIELEATSPGWPPARSLVRRLSRHVPDPVDRVTMRASLHVDSNDVAGALSVAEALEQLGRFPDAATVFQTLTDGPVDADAQRGLTRTRVVAAPLPDVGLGPLSAFSDLPAGASTISTAADAADAVRAAGGELFASAVEALAVAVAPGSGTGAARSAAALLAQAAAVAGADADSAERRLRAALEHDGSNLQALRALRRLLAGRGDAEAIGLGQREAACETVPAHAAATLLLGADLALAGTDPDVAADLLQKALAIQPDNEQAFERLRQLLEKTGDQRRLAEVLAGRIAAAANPFEVTALRLARADLLAGPLDDRAAAEEELSAILVKEPQHARAVMRLAELYYDNRAYARAAELYINRARTERLPERLREIFLRLGRIYTQHAPDTKRAIGAYARVLQLEADNREAMEALSELYAAQGELKNALAITQRLVDLEADADRRVTYLVRLGQLWEKSGDLRQAGARYRRAVDDAPANSAAITELARYLQRTHDVSGQRALLDQSLFVLRRDAQAGQISLLGLRTLAGLLQSRGKMASAAAAVQLAAALDPQGAEAERQAIATWAAPPAETRPLRALARPELDDLLFSAAAPSGLRNVFRMIGETLSRGAADIKRFELGRGDRVSRGHPPRDIIDPIAAQLGVAEFDVYVRPARHPNDLAPLVVVPGEPAVLVLGAALLKLGPAAVRFAGARALRLMATHLDLVLAAPPSDTAALIGALAREFVADFAHPDIPTELMNAGAARLARALPRKLRQDVMPFALESASSFNPTGFHEAVRDSANAVGLLASGNLPVCLAVILATTSAGTSLSLPAVSAQPEALALLNFALSDSHDDLSRAME